MTFHTSQIKLYGILIVKRNYNTNDDKNNNNYDGDDNDDNNNNKQKSTSTTCKWQTHKIIGIVCTLQAE